MNSPRVLHEPGGDLRIDRLAPAFLTVLYDLPHLLDPDQPEAVKRRLYPFPSDDEGECAEWERLVHPDLFALVASARRIVLRDLASLQPAGDDDDPGTWTLVIPAAHVPGWLSALNAARLTLGELHDLGEEDLRDDRVPEKWGDREFAIARLHLLGWLQQLILEDRYPPPPGEEDDAEGAGEGIAQDG